MTSTPQKRSYHPFVLIAYYLNFLPTEMLQAIPYSTRHEWKHKNLEALYGTAFFNDNQKLFKTLESVAQYKKLQTTIRVLIKIIALKNFIANYQHRLKINLGQIQQVAVANIRKINRYLPLATIFKALHIDSKTYYRWRNNTACKLSAIGQCIIKHPAQLLTKEVQLIKDYSDDQQYSHWPLASLFHLMKRNGHASYNISTFYKYCKALKIKRTKPRHRRKNKTTGIRVEAPLQLLHIDVTILRLPDNSKAYIHVIKDNFSKAILHCSAQSSLKATYTIEALKQVFIQYQGLFPPEVSLMTDDGSENTSIKDWIAINGLKVQCRHVIAQADVPFSNSMVEAANKSLKYSGLYLQPIPDFKTLQKILPDIHHDHLHKPLHDLEGRTPYEVLHNIPYPTKPDNNAVITAQERIKQNKQIQCCKGFSF